MTQKVRFAHPLHVNGDESSLTFAAGCDEMGDRSARSGIETGDADRTSTTPFGQIPMFWVLVALVALMPAVRALPAPAEVLWTFLGIGWIVATGLLGQWRVNTWSMISLVLSYFLGVATLTASVVSSNTGASALAGMRMILFAGLLALPIAAMSQLIGSRIRVLVAWFLAAQTVSAVCAVLQAGGISVLGYESVLGRSPGLALHPNVLGFFAAVSALICLHALRVRVRGSARFFVFASLVSNLLALALSGSTSSMLSLAVSILIYAIASRVRLAMIVAGAFIAVVLVLGVNFLAAATGAFSSPVARLAQVTGQTEKISTLDYRFMTIDYAINSALKDPLYGVGLDDVSGGTFDGVTVAHNLLARLFFQGGLGGLIAAGVFILMWLILLTRTVRSPHLGIYGSVAMVLVVYSMTSATLQQFYYWLPYALASGLVFSGAIRHDRVPTSRRSSRGGSEPTGTRSGAAH